MGMDATKGRHDDAHPFFAGPPRNPILGLIFSKDRAMQLEAGLASLFLHCKDPHLLDLKVLYTTSSRRQERLYDNLASAYPPVEFIPEKDFRGQVLGLLGFPYEAVLFLVDDNLFIGD